MFIRTADIYLSSKQLDERAAAGQDTAKSLRPGKMRDRILRDARQDQAMAEMKRIMAEDRTAKA